MYTDENNNLENQLEKVPGQAGEVPLTPEQMQEAQKWDTAMAGMPEKSLWPEQPEGLGVVEEPGAEKPGNATETGAETEISADFASVNRLNNFFKLDAVSEYYGSDGIEKVIDGVSTFDTSNARPDNIATQFFMHMGISSQEEYKKICDMDSAMKEGKVAAKHDNGDRITSMAGLLSDFDNMKELIEEVKMADPAASEALSTGDGGYFHRIEVAAKKKLGKGGVTGVFEYLSEKNEAQGTEAEEEFIELEDSIEAEETGEKPKQEEFEKQEEEMNEAETTETTETAETAETAEIEEEKKQLEHPTEEDEEQQHAA